MLELPWPAVTGNHAVKHTRTGGHFKTAKAVGYEAAVALLLGHQGLGQGNGRKPLAGPLSVSWVLAPPDRRARDVDNVRKTVADALTKAGFWADDSCKVIRREEFEWTDPEVGGKLLLTVKEL
jgi:crossover junction endodeoxyribonuclease RusA